MAFVIHNSATITPGCGYGAYPGPLPGLPGTAPCQNCTVYCTAIQATCSSTSYDQCVSDCNSCICTNCSALGIGSGTKCRVGNGCTYLGICGDCGVYAQLVRQLCGTQYGYPAFNQCNFGIPDEDDGCLGDGDSDDNPVCFTCAAMNLLIPPTPCSVPPGTWNRLQQRWRHQPSCCCNNSYSSFISECYFCWHYLTIKFIFAILLASALKPSLATYDSQEPELINSKDDVKQSLIIYMTVNMKRKKNMLCNN